MKYILFTCFLLSALINARAQTKKIAWKSHSGDEALFALAYENHLFDIDADNEGLRTDDYSNIHEYIPPSLPDTLIQTKNGIILSYKSVIRNDSLFNQQPNMTDSVRKHFKKQSPASGKKKKKQGYIVPYIPEGPTLPPGSGTPWTFVGIVALFAMFTGLFSWHYKQIG